MQHQKIVGRKNFQNFIAREEKIEEIEILRFLEKFYILSQHAVVVNQNSNRHFFRIEIKNCKY